MSDAIVHRFGATYGVQNEGWNQKQSVTLFFLWNKKGHFWGGQYTCVVLKTRDAVTHKPMDSLKHAGACLQQEKYSSWGSKRRTGNKNRCFLIKRFYTATGFQDFRKAATNIGIVRFKQFLTPIADWFYWLIDGYWSVYHRSIKQPQENADSMAEVAINLAMGQLATANLQKNICPENNFDAKILDANSVPQLERHKAVSCQKPSSKMAGEEPSGATMPGWSTKSATGDVSLWAAHWKWPINWLGV